LEKIQAQGVEFPYEPMKIVTEQDYRKAIKGMLGAMENVEDASFSALTSRSRIVEVARAKTANGILERVGSEMQLYRSWGRQGKVNGRAAEQNFKVDHDGVKNMSLTEPPKRTVFGLPHNYFFSSSKENIEINAYFGNTEGRRASPLLLHVHRLGREKYIGVHTLMPTLFLPEDAQVRVKNRRTRQILNLEPRVDYGVLKTYLDRFDGERIV
jgi:CRISPR-associated protein Cmr1